MQFRIKSLPGAMFLLAAFVLSVFQFSEAVCALTSNAANSRGLMMNMLDPAAVERNYFLNRA